MSVDESGERAESGARAGATRLRVLQALRLDPAGLGVQALAARLDVHPNTVRFHLDRLVAEGLAARRTEDRAAPGRPRLEFTAVDRPDVEADRRSYRLLAEILAGFVASEVPDPAAGAVGAGRRWGHYLTERPRPFQGRPEEEAVSELMRIQDDLGFAPELADRDGGQEIHLRHCPFLEVATEHREVACSVHLGLMQGALAEMRAPVTAERLLPFVEPSLCVARLVATGDAEGSEHTPD
jgi:predicted ArsR family transcriptional regulator